MQSDRRLHTRTDAILYTPVENDGSNNYNSMTSHVSGSPIDLSIWTSHSDPGVLRLTCARPDVITLRVVDDRQTGSLKVAT